MTFAHFEQVAENVYTLVTIEIQINFIQKWANPSYISLLSTFSKNIQMPQSSLHDWFNHFNFSSVYFFVIFFVLICFLHWL